VRERGYSVTIVFDWMNRKLEPLSLATVKLPWGTPQSLCEIIIKNPRTPWPEEDSGARIRWAAGALDGVMSHHAGRGDGAEDVSRVLVSVRALLAKSSDANLQKVYDAVCKAPAPGVCGPTPAGDQTRTAHPFAHPQAYFWCLI
jgi:hypothetical protein